MQEHKRDLFLLVKQSKTFRNLITAYSLDKKSVLDVGSSEGHYLQCFGKGSVGITIIPEHVEEAKRRGLEVIMSNVEDPHFTIERKFEVVWANNFFEHMNAPHLFLTKMKEQLTEEGTLILGVPVIPHAPFLTRVRKFRGAYAVSHVNFFTRKTLIETVRAAGWDVQEARSFRFSFPFIDNLLNIITPHVYVVAKPNKEFEYAHKRMLSLQGY